ncbi:MAG: HAD family hydrolase, partial [Chloroflexi bacterium]|nr:HAD family hydrolase [Chloroflexota bacterium]
MARFRAVLFDADDTLIAGTPDYVDLYGVCARDMGVELARRDILKALFSTWTDRSAGQPAAALAVPNGPSARYEHAVQEEVTIYAAAGAGDRARAIAERFLSRSVSPEVFRPYPEVPGVLGSLRAAGLRLGLLTNRSWRVQEFIEALGLGGYFDAVVACGEVGVHKPDQRVFRHALDALGATAADTLYVG